MEKRKKIVFKEKGIIEVEGKAIGYWKKSSLFSGKHRNYVATFKVHQFEALATGHTKEDVKQQIMLHVNRSENPYYKHCEEVEHMLHTIVHHVCDLLAKCDNSTIKLLMWTLFPRTTALCGEFDRCDRPQMFTFLYERFRDYAMAQMDEGNGLFSMRQVYKSIQNGKR
jgi:hypothetical protein